jgi:ABC-2 type transport system permease protein
MYVVFVRFLKFGMDPISLLLGVVLWSYFAEVTLGGIGSIVGRGDLLRKLNFPRYVIVLSTAFSGLINLLLNLAVVVIFMLLAHRAPHISMVFFPLLLLELFVVSVSLAFFLSALFVRFRDLSHIWELILQAMFYATPIFYPLTYVPAKYAKYLILNPLAQIIQDSRVALLGSTNTNTITNYYPHTWVRLIPVGLILIVAVVSVTYFRRRSRFFAEEV